MFVVFKKKERGKEIERQGFQIKKFDYYMRSRFEFPNMFDSHENLLTFIDHYRRKPTNRIVYSIHVHLKAVG